MAGQLFIFKKWGIEKIELELSMKHAIENFKVCGLTENEQCQLRDECLERIGCICKSVCIREVFADGTLDERKQKVNEIYTRRLGFAEYNEETLRTDGPSIIQQRNPDYMKRIQNTYIKALETLFKSHDNLTAKYLMMDSGRLCFKKFPAEGCLTDIRNPSFDWDLLPFSPESNELSTEEFCEVIISEMTTKWARVFIRLNQQEFSELDRNQLKADFKNAYIALTGCFAMEMIYGNNFFENIGVWVGHVKVIIALSVYLSVLDSVLHKTCGCGCREPDDI